MFVKKSSVDYECFDMEMKIVLFENLDEGLILNLSVVVLRRFDVCVFFVQLLDVMGKIFKLWLKFWVIRVLVSVEIFLLIIEDVLIFNKFWKSMKWNKEL